MILELRDLTPDERLSVQQRFETLTAERFAPSKRNPRLEIWWPKAPLDARVFPEGILPSAEDDEFNDSTRLLGFLGTIGRGEYFVGDLGAYKPYFRHAGKLDEELAGWIRMRLVSNPTCLLSVNKDAVVIIDEKLRYSVIGGSPDIIEQFERRFGGPDAVRQRFADYLDRMRFGAGEGDRKWAQDYLVKWSGWFTDP
jgi:hypothetical protein